MWSFIKKKIFYLSQKPTFILLCDIILIHFANVCLMFLCDHVTYLCFVLFSPWRVFHVSLNAKCGIMSLTAPHTLLPFSNLVWTDVYVKLQRFYCTFVCCSVVSSCAMSVVVDSTLYLRQCALGPLLLSPLMPTDRKQLLDPIRLAALWAADLALQGWQGSVNSSPTPSP